MQVQEGDEVTITFDVQVPDAGAATRVMGDEIINTLHLIVFDERGYFLRAQEATLAADPAYPLDPTTRSFEVTLNASSNGRIIHFVANIDPDQFAAITAGHEDYIMSNLYVDDTADAYWQRMEFTGGISATSGANVFDGSDVVPLIRNYAKVQVVDATGNNDAFTLTGYKVFNTRNRGSVAAYNGEFVNFTEMDPETDDNGKMFTPKTYAEMGNYSGFELGDLVEVGDYSNPNATYYVRETSKESKPFIIIEGTYNGAECYYKLDFIVGGNNANILRNFAYTFVINTVTKPGTTEAAAKAQSTGENGLSFDSNTSSLLNISDGVGQLFVSATQVILTSTDEYYLMYKYIPDITNPTTNVNVGVTHNAKAGDVFASVVREGTIGDADDNSGTGTKYAGYKYIVLKPNTLTPGSTPEQTITITNGAGLTREVEFSLKNPYTMTVTAYDGEGGVNDNEVARDTNKKVWVDVAIPADLEEYIFPLEFVFESSALSIYPDAGANNMPVSTGQSIIDSSKSAFGFVYTLTWDEYAGLTTVNGQKTFTAKFLTNKAANESQVYVANHYFNTGFDEDGGFVNPAITYATELKLGNINAAHAYQYPQYPNNGDDYLETNNRNVTIYTKNGSNVSGGNTTYSFDENGPRNNVTTITINGENLNLTTEDYVYFRFTRTGSMGGGTTYYAYVKVSDLNADGANITLNFTTTNPL